MADNRTGPATARDVLQKIRARQAGRKPLVVSEWRSMLPPGSRWFPGCLGKPNCPHCKGIGYVRFDLPVGSAEFGRLFECECTGGG